MTAHRIDFCPHCGGRLEVRTAEQNKKFHSILQDIADQRQWAGHWLTAEDWKRLITAAYERANKQGARVFPSIDGQGIDMLYRRTSRMSKQEMSDLIDFATSWALENEIALTDTPPLFNGGMPMSNAKRKASRRARDGFSRQRLDAQQRHPSTPIVKVEMEEIDITCPSCDGSAVEEDDGRERPCKECCGMGMIPVERPKENV